MVALLAVAALFYAMPPALKVGPEWLFFALVVALTAPGVCIRTIRHLTLMRVMGYAAVSIMTLAMIASLWLLVSRLPQHKETPAELLRAATALWIDNVLVFASWYWRLDAGGPYQRDLRGSHTDGAFLFPQMALPPLSARRWARMSGVRLRRLPVSRLQHQHRIFAHRRPRCSRVGPKV